jgi:hypothetical protein
VRELQKPANTRCEHQSRKGCAIYHQLGFPSSCGLWNCAWLGGEEDLVRPDRCGWVVDVVPDMLRLRNNETGAEQGILVVQVWVEHGRDLTFDPRLRRLALRSAAKNMALLLRYGSADAIAVFPPALATDGQWHFVRQSGMTMNQSSSGNLFIDLLKEQQRHGLVRH